MADAQRLLSIQDGGAQQAWLQVNAPLPDASLVADLCAEVAAHRYIDPRRTLTIAQTIKLAAEFWGDRLTHASAEHALADAYSYLGKHREAVAHFDLASRQFIELGQPHRAAQVDITYINSLTYLGNYAAIEEVADRAKASLLLANDIVGQGHLHSNLGIRSYRMGRLQDADSHFTVARPLLEQANRPEAVAMLQANHANVQIELDLFDAAQKNLQEARAIFALANASQAVAHIDSNIAYLLFSQGEYQKALNQFELARPIFEATESVFELITLDLHCSEIYLALNLWHEALQIVDKARQRLSDRDELPWEVGRLWLNEAVALARNDRDYLDALAAARAVFATENNQYWLAIADLYESTFAYRVNDLNVAASKAHSAATEFTALGVLSRAARSEILLGNIRLTQKNLLAAATHFSNAQVLLGKAHIPTLTYAIRYGLGQIDVLNGKTQSALSLLRQAVDDVEQLQGTITAEDFKIAYLADKMQVYEALVRLCLEIDTEASLQEAFATIERAKSRALLDAIAVYSDQPESENKRLGAMEEILELKRDLNWYYNKLNNPPDDGVRSSRYLTSINDAVNIREQTLQGLLQRLRAPVDATVSNPIWTATVESLQNVLPRATLLLEYYTLSEQIIVFGICANDVWRLTLPISVSEVGDLLSQLRFQMNKFGYGERYRQRHADKLQRSCDDVLQQLHAALIQPLLGRVSAENIVIVPHGTLHYVPFHALFDGQSYLIEKYPISYSPSATLFSRTTEKTSRSVTAPPKIIGLDDPTIPFAQDEAIAIAELFLDAELYVGDDANVENVINQTVEPAFLHFSTHALFRSDNATFSSLKLQDGWLNVHDIYKMRNVPELVTLSACETGRHQILRGDELMGLCRGFFAIGARSLVVSLWMVEDKAAAELMTHFYTMLKDGQAVNDALRAAQLKVMKKNPHPYYWAPFILTGSMGTKISLN